MQKCPEAYVMDGINGYDQKEVSERCEWRVCEEAGSRDLGERTTEFAKRIIHLFGALPKTTVAQTLGKQILRSGTSVGANFRESRRARSKAEFIAKMGDCLRELDETAYWLELLDSERLLATQRLASLCNETDQLISIFVSSLNRAKSPD